MFSFMNSEAIIAKAKNVTRVGSGLFVTHDTDVSPAGRAAILGFAPLLHMRIRVLNLI